MRLTKRIFSRLFNFITTSLLVSGISACGDDPGLYQQETLTFESGASFKESEQELNLGADDADEFGAFPLPFAPGPFFGGLVPIWPFYLTDPVPVTVPISEFQALTEWIHPMYAVSMFSPFGPF